MRLLRIAVTAAVAAVTLVPLTATGASAAAPGNDTPKGAVALTLGQSYSEDTSQATTGPLDAKVNQICGAPFTNASVWFTYTPSTDGAFLLDMSSSSYTGGFMVFSTKVELATFRGCGPETVAIKAKAGKTYYIAAFSDTSTNGGDLELSLQQGPPDPTANVTVNPNGKAFANGNAQLSGTFSCTNATYAENFGTLTQIWKRVKITGFYDTLPDPTLCDGATHNWKATVVSDNGLYASGDATVSASFDACGLINCVEVDLSNQAVTLQGPANGARSGLHLKPTMTVTTKDRGILNWKTAQAH